MSGPAVGSTQWYWGLFSRGVSGWGTKLTTRLRQLPRLRMSGAIPLLLPCAFMACTGTILPFYI